MFDYPGDTIVEKLQESGYTTRLWTANIQIHAWDGWDRSFDEVRGPGELDPLADDPVDWSAFSKENERSGPLMYLNAIRHAVRTGIAFESRGQDLFQNVGPTDRLVEGVGELYNRLDGDLNGIVTESGTYYYETHDDGLCCEEGPVGEGVRARLDDYMGRLSKRSMSQDESDIPSDVRDRLKDLGYA